MYPRREREGRTPPTSGCTRRARVLVQPGQHCSPKGCDPAASSPRATAQRQPPRCASAETRPPRGPRGGSADLPNKANIEAMTADGTNAAQIAHGTPAKPCTGSTIRATTTRCRVRSATAWALPHHALRPSARHRLRMRRHPPRAAGASLPEGSPHGLDLSVRMTDLGRQGAQNRKGARHVRSRRRPDPPILPGTRGRARRPFGVIFVLDDPCRRAHEHRRCAAAGRSVGVRVLAGPCESWTTVAF
jgi:hypothetical protein